MPRHHPRGSVRRRAGGAAPGVLCADLVYLGAELGEPVFVAGALVGQPGLGVGSFVLDALPGGGQLRDHLGVRGPGRRSPAPARRRPGRVARWRRPRPGRRRRRAAAPPRRGYAVPGPAPRRPRPGRRWPPPVARHRQRLDLGGDPLGVLPRPRPGHAHRPVQVIRDQPARRSPPRWRGGPARPRPDCAWGPRSTPAAGPRPPRPARRDARTPGTGRYDSAQQIHSYRYRSIPRYTIDVMVYGLR